MILELILPYPPSTNHYIASSGNRRYLTREAKSYRQHVWTLILGQSVRFGARKLKINIEAYPPDNRRRDIDNLLKNILDALEYAQLYNNDNQIDDLHIVRREVKQGGQVYVCLESLSD